MIGKQIEQQFVKTEMPEEPAQPNQIGKLPNDEIKCAKFYKNQAKFY